MTLAEELQRSVAPFYQAYQRKTKQSRYPPDQNGERFCPGCGFKPFEQFRDYGTRLKRQCKRCEMQTIIAARQAKRLMAAP